MKQEMRKLNRARYAHTAEEMAQLAAQGYVPVGTTAADPPDAASGQPSGKIRRRHRRRQFPAKITRRPNSLQQRRSRKAAARISPRKKRSRQRLYRNSLQENRIRQSLYRSSRQQIRRRL